MASPPVGFGIVGFGYWGPKVLRNLESAASTRPLAICESDLKKRVAAHNAHISLHVCGALDELLAVPGLEAVAVATPVESHYDLGRKVLEAGKHLFVEKPFTRTADQAIELIRLARQVDRLIMVDHTFLYTAAVRKLRDVVHGDELGELLYYDSIRINLGLFQPDVDVIWDLAPHDFSILDYVVQRRPKAISAIGAVHSPSRHCDIAYLTLDFGEGFLAHIHLNWLAPMKVRQILIGGSERMVQYNDVLPDEKIRVYDRGIEIRPKADDSVGRTITPDDRQGEYQAMISYRTGDVHAPWLDRTEALFAECQTFGTAIRSGGPYVNDPVAGLRIVLMLEAASRSLAQNGEFVGIDWERLQQVE